MRAALNESDEVSRAPARRGAEDASCAHTSDDTTRVQRRDARRRRATVSERKEECDDGSCNERMMGEAETRDAMRARSGESADPSSARTHRGEACRCMSRLSAVNRLAR